ncbi:hypothetical protein [Trueperella pyogenes]|uniref:hypothetical protein n=1 Tax=Trueperella pyogenes TaxID=1661 RepID=UPI003DA92ED4
MAGLAVESGLAAVGAALGAAAKAPIVVALMTEVRVGPRCSGWAAATGSAGAGRSAGCSVCSGRSVGTGTVGAGISADHGLGDSAGLAASGAGSSCPSAASSLSRVCGVSACSAGSGRGSRMESSSSKDGGSWSYTDRWEWTRVPPLTVLDPA